MMHFTIMVFLCVIYYYISFTYLLAEPIRFPYSICLIGFYFLLSLLSPLTGQWGTFLLVLCSAFLIYFATGRQLFAVILSCMGYLLAIAVNHLCTIPLSLIGMAFPTMEADFSIPFMFLAIIVTIVLLFAVKKFFIIPRLYFLQNCPLRLQWLFLLQILLCIMVMAINFIYGEYSGYPTHILIFNGLLILIFTLVTLLLFTSLFYLLQTNYNLSLQQKEQHLLQEYTQHLENFYDEFRVFRHDYKNILSTMQYYIEDDDINALKEYFNHKVLPSGMVLSSDGFTIGKLHLLRIPTIKSLIYIKIISALNYGIHVSLELTEPVSSIDMDELDLSRVLGILLDNASEAALLTDEKMLRIAILPTESGVLFSITNSTPPLSVPLSRLYEKGYTTKEAHDGLGLYQVDHIIRPLENVFFKMEYHQQIYQTLEIRAKETL